MQFIVIKPCESSLFKLLPANSEMWYIALILPLQANKGPYHEDAMFVEAFVLLNYNWLIGFKLILSFCFIVIRPQSSKIVFDNIF